MDPVSPPMLTGTDSTPLQPSKAGSQNSNQVHWTPEFETPPDDFAIVGLQNGPHTCAAAGASFISPRVG